MRLTSALALATMATVSAAVPVRPAQQTPPTFRSTVDTVSIYATVRASDGRLVPDLEQTDFEVKDNGSPRPITIFSREIVPITVTLMLDMSGSREQKVEWMRDAALAFVDALLPADRARIGTFGAEIAMSPRLTGDKTYLRRVINEEIWPGGPTPLWEAIDMSMASLQAEAGRRVVLVVTDGYDTTGGRRPVSGVPPGGALPPGFSLAGANVTSMGPSSAGRVPTALDDVLGHAKRDGFMIYAVSIGFSTPTGEALNLPMKLVATETGGGYHTFESSKDAVQAMVQVAEELHHQYMLGFQPAVADGKTHKLDVRVNRPGMSAQARKTYVAQGK